MIAYYPSVYFGTLAAETVRIAFIVPKREGGLVVKGLDVFLDTEQAPSNANYWVIELGTMVGQMDFTPSAQRASPTLGFARGRNEVAFPAAVTYDVGDVVALRALPVGSPSSIDDLQVVVRVEEP